MTTPTRTMPAASKRPKHNAKAQGYRSGLEEKVAASLEARGVDPRFEEIRIPYLPKKKHYTPDFELPNGIIIETKGYFTSADRSKHIQVRDQHPDLDIRFVFSNSRNRLSSKSKTTYAKWCETHGFIYADRDIPDEWIAERSRASRLKAIETLNKSKAAA